MRGRGRVEFEDIVVVGFVVSRRMLCAGRSGSQAKKADGSCDLHVNDEQGRAIREIADDRWEKKVGRKLRLCWRRRKSDKASELVAPKTAYRTGERQGFNRQSKMYTTKSKDGW
ncbi:hypothetical protein HYQ46_006614 [Verticillium longisporum]|nr:hypothetical protein HYQ46_006614 [Verticillium longisporum]